jgi:putative addiction module killer protein
MTPTTIEFYQTGSGHSPFLEWMDFLDPGVRAAIDSRLIRVRRGVYGNTENVGGGVWELKLDIGPGYWVYYSRNGRALIILLCAGDKRNRPAGIETARAFWTDYIRRTRK